MANGAAPCGKRLCGLKVERADDVQLPSVYKPVVTNAEIARCRQALDRRL